MRQIQPYKRLLPGVVLLLVLFSAYVSGIVKQHQWPLIGIGVLFLTLAAFEGAWLAPHKTEESFDKPRLLIDILAASIPVAILWALYHEALNAWWTGDDPAILKSIIQNGVIPHFYKPEIWKQFNTANLTPWVQLSSGFDFHIFGLNPYGFYLHHLLSFSVVVLLGYTVLRLFFPPLISSVILSLFVASSPVATVAQFLMTRHYLEGLGLGCAAFLLYVKALRSGKGVWAWAGSLLYLLACTTKEIYVPLVVVLFFLPVNSLRHRLKHIAPFALVAGIYVIWRAYMLGPENILSGYGDIHGKPGWKEIVGFPSRIMALTGWNSYWQWVALALAFLPFLYVLIKDRSMSERAFAVVLAITVIAPIIPVIPVMSERYLFLPCFIASIGVGTGLEFYRKRQSNTALARILVLFLFSFLLVSGLKTVEGSSLWKSREAVNAFRATGEFILYGADETAVFIDPPFSLWFYTPLSWIREKVLNLGPGPKVCYDLCACAPGNLNSVYRYKDGAMEKANPAQAAGRADCGNDSADLTVEMYIISNSLRWKFGPYTEGRYYFSGNSEDAYMSGFFLPLPPEGRFPMKLSAQLNFVIRYVSPDGWQTYSPVLTVDGSELENRGSLEFRWKRP